MICIVTRERIFNFYIHRITTHLERKYRFSDFKKRDGSTGAVNKIPTITLNHISVSLRLEMADVMRKGVKP